MKKRMTLSEGSFLKLFFACFTASFLIAAVCMPDRSTMFSGYWKILTQPAKVATNYFAVGGYSATFLNMGLVALVCTLVQLPDKDYRGSTLPVILTTGFGSWGLNPLNMLPTMLGVALYGLVKKERNLANAMLFSTGIAPLMTDLVLRYPGSTVAGFRWWGLALALVIGLAIGFFLPAGLARSPKVHKGLTLYSAALPVGMTAFLLQGLLFQTMGVALPPAPAAETLTVASKLTVNLFCCILFGLCVLGALLLGCRPKDYWRLLRSRKQISSVSGELGNAVFLMNFGVYGLFILGYYNLIGATMNGVTFGVIFCMLCCCNSGSHPGNVLPILLGYVAASFGMGWLSKLAGGSFAGAINAQAIVVGVCYANGLSPITDRYGVLFGFGASVLHYLLVTSVPMMHGGFCLYNGGFTAALVCVLLLPELKRFARTRDERLAAVEHGIGRYNDANA